MNRFVLFLVLFPILAFGVRRPTAAEQKALTHGAEACVVFRVIDVRDRPVEKALVEGNFWNDTRKGNPYSMNTDSNGVCVVTRTCSDDYHFAVTKEGYYRTKGRKVLWNPNFISIKDGKWQPYGATNTVVLKRKVNPVAMCVAWNEARSSLPDEDCLIGYDMKTADWVMPWGKGKTADFFIRYVRQVGTNRLEIKSTLTIAFTNVLDGVYRMKTDDSGSAMRTVYKADTNAVYARTLAFVYDRTAEKINTDTYLTPDDYLVLRTRTECDGHGNLKKANYAKIVGKLAITRENKLKIRFYFNPNENDPNLEADTTKNLLNPRDLGFPP
ncbi:MAG: hypothetical protein PHV28_05765 [Kiritimatiellae bacterium]|nr:hypothetical protein [Kiritimatiellia bacterium]